MNRFERIFSSTADLSRVNPAGLAVMLAGLLVVILAGGIARSLKPETSEGTTNAIKVLGLVICAGGALLAILG